MNLFEDNKYTKWYFSIIEKAKTRTQTPIGERHHIIPRGVGGTEDSSNLITLTLKEHFVVHLLLTKMCVQLSHKRNMLYASYMMICRTGKKSSKLYEAITIKRNKERSKNNKETSSHIRLHTKENSEKARLTKIARKYKAWNNGIPNSNGAINGKRSAPKMKNLATGRRRYYQGNTWTWIYPRNDGRWFKHEKLSKYSSIKKEVDITPPL